MGPDLERHIVYLSQPTGRPSERIFGVLPGFLQPAFPTLKAAAAEKIIESKLPAAFPKYIYKGCRRRYCLLLISLFNTTDSEICFINEFLLSPSKPEAELRAEVLDKRDSVIKYILKPERKLDELSLEYDNVFFDKESGVLYQFDETSGL